jgi:thioredoxin 1
MYLEISNLEDHEKIIKNSKICVLDFYADWCGPCKKLGPLLQDTVIKNNKLCTITSTGYDDLSEKIVFAKINIDDLQDLANIYNIKSIPQISFYKNGKLHDKFITGLKVDDIILTINELLE